MILVLAYQSLAALGVFTWFVANQPYIAEYICENRDSPELQCGGQCVLMKKLKDLQEDDNESSPSMSTKRTIEVVLYSPLNLNELLPSKIQTEPPVFRVDYEYLSIQTITHPPKIDC